MTNQNDVADSFASGNIPSLLKKMAIPGVISQILLLLYNMVDRIYLGRLNDGGTALLAVGLCLPVTYVFNAVAFLFGQGGAARATVLCFLDGKALFSRILCDSYTDSISADQPFHRTGEGMPFYGNNEKTDFSYSTAFHPAAIYEQ